MNIFIKSFIYLVVFTLLHFGYDITGWIFLKPFCGIDESLFQHLKMAFWAYLITSLLEALLVKNTLHSRSRFWYPRLFSAIILPWVTLLIWYLVPAVFGKLHSNIVEVFWAIFCTYFGVFIVVLFEKTIEKNEFGLPAKIAILLLFLISAFLFIRFTYKLPWIDLFVNPTLL